MKLHIRSNLHDKRRWVIWDTESDTYVNSAILDLENGNHIIRSSETKNHFYEFQCEEDAHLFMTTLNGGTARYVLVPVQTTQHTIFITKDYEGDDEN